jgi:large conductance mechanosensitive channel
MFKEFKEFATRGNALDLAIGLVLGTAFSGVVNTLVNGILMPPIGLLLGGADFTDLFVTMKHGTPAGPYASLLAAEEAGAVTLNYGLFVNALITFIVVAFAMFLLVKSINRLYAPAKGKAKPKRK